MPNDSMPRRMIAGRSVVFGWLAVAALTVALSAAFECQRLARAFQVEAGVPHRLAAQRGDQHDAHLTSLSSLASGADHGGPDTFVEVAGTIMCF